MAHGSSVVNTDGDPMWYKDAIIYEVHVRAFCDGSSDGMGDFTGLTSKLDYLQDLGITAVWVLPFCPSPWRDDGYDISDYTGVHPAYGNLRDFQVFLREAHRRGLRVITELVLNHTSDQHQWFQRSRRSAPGSRWRNYYVWSDTPDKYREARIIFKDFETSNWTWDPVARAYYWHRFYSHQPDLNFDNPEVHSSVMAAMDFWLGMGVDGLRLDAVPYLYECEGTNCENLPETHAFLCELRAHIDARYPGRMLLAEANQWPEDSIAYFGQGNECHMAFHFPVMPRLFMATRMEDRYPVTEILQLTPAIPDACQWALFLRNHDELTLEMVTDEERDYMYRVYAQDRHMRINLGIRRRLAPLLENDRRRIELMNALMFSLPGTPVIYYGDEIGMGDNFYLGDRNGVRTPMQWSADRNAGFSRSNPQRLYLPVIIDPEYHYEAINVETQQNNPHSLLWWMKRLIAQRKQAQAFGRGTLEFLSPANRRVLAFVRSFNGERILVVANLSRFAQCTELDLSRFQGTVPVEMFGRTEFSSITEKPYFLSLAPHAFYWFALQPKGAAQEIITPGATELPVFAIPSWEEVFTPRTRASIERLLPAFLRARRWFLSKHRVIRFVQIDDVIILPKSSSYILILRVEYTEGDPEYYVQPVTLVRAEAADQVRQELAEFIMARVETVAGEQGVIYSAFRNRAFADELLGAMSRRRRFESNEGEVAGSHTRAFRQIWSREHGALEPSPVREDQNNTSIIFGDRFVLKLYRRIEPGIHPEREIGAFLTERSPAATVPRLAGALEYRPSDREPMTLAVLHEFIHSEADGWRFTIDNLGLFFEHALALGKPEVAQMGAGKSPLVLAGEVPPDAVRELIGSYLQIIELLGRRTADMHISLARHDDDPIFAPEPFTDFYRHSLYHGMLGRCTRVFSQLRMRLPQLPEPVQPDVERLMAREAEIRTRLQRFRDQRVPALRMRHHDDYDLRQVLFTGKDFVIIDFEGNPSHSAGERRIKRSSLRDVASMLRSFSHAAHGALYGRIPGVVAQKETAASIEHWVEFWYRWVGAAFLAGYLNTDGIAELLPAKRDELKLLLETYLLEKALSETAFELENRPDWLPIPIYGILDLLDPQ